MMNKERDKCVESAPRSQKASKVSSSRQETIQKRKKEENSHNCSQTKGISTGIRGVAKEGKTPARRPGSLSTSAATECPRSPAAQRKLSDASNASEDLSKDSGCLSGKLSSDSSSEISDSEGNKRDSPISDKELNWTDGRAYRSPTTDGKDSGKVCVRPAGTTCCPPTDTPGPGGAMTLYNSSGAFMHLMMAETTDDLVKEVDDLRSENEYLRDEVEELRCEMLEMRDMFQEEETCQLQDLRQKLDQANKTCRILQYRLRKAERRSIRVAQTGQVDGELVRTLEHDIKVAKSVSLRLYTELEAVQKKNSQLEWENEMLRERTQELEVAKHVLQAELEKSCLKKRSIRSAANKAERRLSQQIEDDNDLKCQLHFAKEELALMCKKLTKLVSESEVMHEQLSRYHSLYGDIDAAQSPEGKQRSSHAREAEVKVHLKLVEEEAMLLSRRIVELEVENRGLRAEMNDLREKEGGADEEGNRNVSEEHLSPSTLRKNRKQRCQRLKIAVREMEEDEKAAQSLVEKSSLTEGQIPSCHVTREGPVGGEWDPSENASNQTSDNNQKGITVNDFTALVALRDHALVVSSTIQFMASPSKPGHYSSSSGIFNSNGKTQTLFFPGSLNEALELLQAMLQAFIIRMEVLLTDQNYPHKESRVWDCNQDMLSQGLLKSEKDQKCVHENVETERPEERSSKSDLVYNCREPKMQLSLQILWILHQWCQEGNEAKVKTLSMLRVLLQSLGAELQEETLDSKTASVVHNKAAAECAVSGIVNDERPSDADRMSSSIRDRLKRQLSPHSYKRKDWCYLSQQAAQLDREDPVKTWDHLIMPLSFPDLNFERMSMERSHTAPEKSTLRIYFSPPSKRRVQMAQLKQSPESDRESVDTQSPWCTPPTSFSTLCVGSSANLSDDMKEMAASWRHSSSEVNRARVVGEGGVDVACSGTHTLTRPQMVSVGLQTEGLGPTTVGNSPSRAVNSSLLSPRSRHISTSLDRLTSKTERPKFSTSSPKLYRSQSCASSGVPSSNLSPSPASASRDRMSNGFHQRHSGLVLTRQTSPRAAAGQNRSESPGQNLKPPNKSAGGLVTEFLRRVSGRTDKTVPPSGQKMKSNLERVPVRTSTTSLSRSDSVTRIVNHRFMKQREEVSGAQREEKRSTGSNSATHSLSSIMADDYQDCSSSSTLTFCFARPFRSTARQTSNQSKVLRYRYQNAASAAAESNCQ
uniref:uncharacterized protein LOC131104323 n=1 Tax=Doryrhamphus excisus TaxID=161450 RepID=UPI0025AE0112|nr:uncharacterized protein LOC131104323 [Doryrhamphus excisus]XP_057907357.1 uncharacterized protein LOC131104323 [Doryrhamphus excisus]XP_057907358.1 uncharacterized protein LOC131104323 [Doryrhamphus excisus]